MKKHLSSLFALLCLLTNFSVLTMKKLRQDLQSELVLYSEESSDYDSVDILLSSREEQASSQEQEFIDCSKLCGDVVFCKIFLFADLETFKRLRLAFCNKEKYQAIFDRILFDFDPRRFDSGSSREIIGYKDLKFLEISEQAQELIERIEKEDVVRVVFKKGDSAEIKLLDENNVENELYDMLRYEDPILLDALRNIVEHEVIIDISKLAIVGGIVGGIGGVILGGIGGVILGVDEVGIAGSIITSRIIRDLVRGGIIGGIMGVIPGGIGGVSTRIFKGKGVIKGVAGGLIGGVILGRILGGIVSEVGGGVGDQVTGAIVGAIVGRIGGVIEGVDSWGIWDCINGCCSSRKRKLEERLREAISSTKELREKKNK